MRFLLEPDAGAGLDALTAAAQAAADAGLDGVLLAAGPSQPAPLVTAAALGARVGDLRIAVELAVGDRHPFEVAEELAVVDLALAGRLVGVLRPAPGLAGAYAEAVELIRTALTARPFRFAGDHWSVPADLEQNVHRIDDMVRLMPPPVQLRLELWCSGAGGRATALAGGLGHLADAGDDPAALGAAFAAAAPRPQLGALRARRERCDDPAELVARLRAGRAAFGQDCAVVAGDAAVAQTLGTRVLPRVQLNRLPVGLEAHWDALLAGGHA